MHDAGLILPQIRRIILITWPLHLVFSPRTCVLQNPACFYYAGHADTWQSILLILGGWSIFQEEFLHRGPFTTRVSLPAYWKSTLSSLPLDRFPEIPLTLMLLVENFANTKWYKKPWKWLKLWQMGTHLRVLNERYPMNTNTTGFRWFS